MSFLGCSDILCGIIVATWIQPCLWLGEHAPSQYATGVRRITLTSARAYLSSDWFRASIFGTAQLCWLLARYGSDWRGFWLAQLFVELATLVSYSVLPFLWRF